MWSRFRPEDLATPEAFRAHPRRVWDWYAERRAQLTRVQPNPAHRALADLARRTPQFTLITQNVDGLHQRAGSPGVIELHGNITRTKCAREHTVVESWPDTGDTPPRCPRCGDFLRPDVVWFGEILPAEALTNAMAAARACDVFLSIGTSALVTPAAWLPEEALSAGAYLVEVNPEPTPLTARVHAFLQGPAGQALPQVVPPAAGERRE